MPSAWAFDLDSKIELYRPFPRHYMERSMKQVEDKVVVVAGVDVASTELVVRVSIDRQVRRFPNESKGIRDVVKLLKGLNVNLVVCEHTGRHEWLLLQSLWKKAIPVHCAHPRAVRNFARVMKENGKSDPIDAAVLVEYGLRMDLVPTAAPSHEIIALRELTGRRDDLNDMLVKEKNRLSAPATSPWLKAVIKQHILQLKTAIKRLEEQMKRLVQSHEALSVPIARLDEEHGVGLVAAAALYSSMPELGTLNRQSCAALAGLAPFIRASGKFAGQRRISGGRTAARKALYMVALCVIRKHRHPMRSLYLHLKKCGKKTMVALTAVMRKLIIRFNTVLKELLLAQQQPLTA